MLTLELPAANATETELIDSARAAVSGCNWIVGQCAAEWTTRYARGRTDADFAALVELSVDQVYQRRRVWETFGDVYGEYPSLRWSHFYTAVAWDDAPECLHWAAENEATVAEMRAWRRASRGEDLEQAADLGSGSALADDPSIAALPKLPARVVDPSDDATGGRRSERAATDADDDNDVPFQPNMPGSANRETAGESEYAPFRKDAGSKPPSAESDDEPADRPADQIARRVTGTLERLVGVLTPQILASFRTLPQKDRARLVEAVRVLADRLTALET